MTIKSDKISLANGNDAEVDHDKRYVENIS